MLQQRFRHDARKFPKLIKIHECEIARGSSNRGRRVADREATLLPQLENIFLSFSFSLSFRVSLILKLHIWEEFAEKQVTV